MDPADLSAPAAHSLALLSLFSESSPPPLVGSRTWKSCLPFSRTPTSRPPSANLPPYFPVNRTSSSSHLLAGARITRSDHCQVSSPACAASLLPSQPCIGRAIQPCAHGKESTLPGPPVLVAHRPLWWPRHSPQGLHSPRAAFQLAVLALWHILPSPACLCSLSVALCPLSM